MSPGGDIDRTSLSDKFTRAFLHSDVVRDRAARRVSRARAIALVVARGVGRTRGASD
jgi:hypothetical protein